MIENRRRMMMQSGGLIPANNQIIYQSTTGKVLDFSGICNASLISNEIVGEYIIATFSENVKTINNGSYIGVKYIDFPKTCATFGRTAFDSSSSNLERVIIRAEKPTFGQYCFSYSNKSLIWIFTFYATTPPVRNANAIGNNPLTNKPTIEVPKGSADAYRNSSYWTGYNIIEMS